MSVTESMDFPPVGELQKDSTGLTAWRPSFEGIEVSLVPRGVKLRVFRGVEEEAFNLSPAEARHIAGLLSKAADTIDGAGA